MTNSETDNTRADIGIVSALPIELGQFMDRCERVKHYKGGDFTFRGGRYDGIRIVVAESGMGYARARKATQAMVDAHAPKWILSSGFAGALLPTMKLGEIIMANEIVDQHGQQISINLTLASDEANGLYVGRILTADEMVRTVEEKKQLHESTKPSPLTWKAWRLLRSPPKRKPASWPFESSVTTCPPTCRQKFFRSSATPERSASARL